MDYILSFLTLIKHVEKLKVKSASDPPPRGRMDWVEYQAPGTRSRPVQQNVRSDDGRSSKRTGEFSWDAATRHSGYEILAPNMSVDQHYRILCHEEPTGTSEERKLYKRRIMTGVALTLR